MAEPKPAIYHLLKSIGFDPTAITDAIATANREIPAFASRVDARITAQELQLSAIDKKLDFIISLLVQHSEDDIEAAIEADAISHLNLLES